MRYRLAPGYPPGIAHAPEVPIGALRAGAITVVLERRSVRATTPPIADSERAVSPGGADESRDSNGDHPSLLDQPELIPWKVQRAEA